MGDFIYQSVYLSTPVLGAHRLTLLLDVDDEEPRRAVLLRDPNTCALDVYGDPTECTEESVTTETFDGYRPERADPAGRDRKLWELRHRPETGPHTYDVSFVVDHDLGRYRLVVTENLNDPKVDVITVVPMYRALGAERE